MTATPVTPFVALLAVIERCREYGHEVVLDGSNLNAAEDAAEALLAALGVQPAPPEPEVRPEVVELLVDTFAPAGSLPHEWTHRDGRRLTPDEQQLAMSSTFAEVAAMDHATKAIDRRAQLPPSD